MINDQRMIEIERAAEATYLNNKDQGSNDYIVNMLYFATQTSHLAEAKEILERSSNLYAQQLAIRYFRIILLTKWETFDALLRNLANNHI